MKDTVPHDISTEQPELPSKRLARIIGYAFKNDDLATFIDANAHPSQFAVFERNKMTPQAQQTFADRIRQIEQDFTPSVARAADIVQRSIKNQKPGLQGVNLDLVVSRATQIVRDEVEELLDPHAALGYRPRHKKR